MELADEGGLEAEIQKADEFKDRVYSAMVKLNKCEDGGHTSTSLTPATAPIVTPSEHRLNLPNIMIQPFDGDLTLVWTSFWDSYDSAIH